MHAPTTRKVANNHAVAIRVQKIIYKPSAPSDANVDLCLDNCNMDCNAVCTCAKAWRWHLV